MNKTLLLLAVVSLTLLSCGDKEDEFHHRTININNMSDETVYVMGDWIYPNWTSFKSALVYGNGGKTNPKEVNKKAFTLEPNHFWENNFGMMSDTLWIYVLDSVKLNSGVTSLDAVRQCYGVTLSDLYRLNWTISYPPTPEMKDIKMYPVYSESAKEETDEKDKG